MFTETSALLDVPRCTVARVLSDPQQARRAKLVFAAAEAARQRGDVAEYERLVTRWRGMAKGIGAN